MTRTFFGPVEASDQQLEWAEEYTGPIANKNDRVWECTLSYEIEKPWTDNVYYGPQYYTPHMFVYAETRGKARRKACDIFKYQWDIDFVEFVDVLVRVCKIDPVNLQMSEVL